MFEFRLKFHRSLFLRGGGAINNIPTLVQIRCQAIIWTNAGWFTDAYMRHSAPMMHQSHPATDPIRFYHPYDFLPVRPSEAPVGILRRCFPVVTSGYGSRTAWHACIHMVWLNNSQDSMGTPCDARTASYGPRTGIFNVFHILRDLCGARAWPARVPYGALTDT